MCRPIEGPDKAGYPMTKRTEHPRYRILVTPAWKRCNQRFASQINVLAICERGI